MAENKKNIVGFKRFSDINSGTKKSKIEEVDPSLEVSPERDSDRPMNPNFNYSKKEEVPASTKDMKPEVSKGDDELTENVETYGKVAKFPKNVKASKAYNFLENVKVSKKSIWYIMVEKMDNELQMVKYNYKEGVDLNKFVNELKSYYMSKYSSDPKVCKLIEGIVVDGNDKYSMVKNIPLVEVDGKKMISIITQDLIKLLSK
jgi:hypothetical protein